MEPEYMWAFVVIFPLLTIAGIVTIVCFCNKKIRKKRNRPKSEEVEDVEGDSSSEIRDSHTNTPACSNNWIPDLTGESNDLNKSTSVAKGKDRSRCNAINMQPPALEMVSHETNSNGADGYARLEFDMHTRHCDKQHSCMKRRHTHERIRRKTKGRQKRTRSVIEPFRTINCPTSKSDSMRNTMILDRTIPQLHCEDSSDTSNISDKQRHLESSKHKNRLFKSQNSVENNVTESPKGQIKRKPSYCWEDSLGKFPDDDTLTDSSIADSEEIGCITDDEMSSTGEHEVTLQRFKPPTNKSKKAKRRDPVYKSSSLPTFQRPTTPTPSSHSNAILSDKEEDVCPLTPRPYIPHKTKYPIKMEELPVNYTDAIPFIPTTPYEAKDDIMSKETAIPTHHEMSFDGCKPSTTMRLPVDTPVEVNNVEDESDKADKPSRETVYTSNGATSVNHCQDESHSYYVTDKINTEIHGKVSRDDTSIQKTKQIESNLDSYDEHFTDLELPYPTSNVSQAIHVDYYTKENVDEQDQHYNLSRSNSMYAGSDREIEPKPLKQRFGMSSRPRKRKCFSLRESKRNSTFDSMPNKNPIHVPIKGILKKPNSIEIEKRNKHRSHEIHKRKNESTVAMVCSQIVLDISHMGNNQNINNQTRSLDLLTKNTKLQTNASNTTDIVNTEATTHYALRQVNDQITIDTSRKAANTQINTHSSYDNINTQSTELIHHTIKKVHTDATVLIENMSEILQDDFQRNFNITTTVATTFSGDAVSRTKPNETKSNVVSSRKTDSLAKQMRQISPRQLKTYCSKTVMDKEKKAHSDSSLNSDEANNSTTRTLKIETLRNTGTRTVHSENIDEGVKLHDPNQTIETTQEKHSENINKGTTLHEPNVGFEKSQEKNVALVEESEDEKHQRNACQHNSVNFRCHSKLSENSTTQIATTTRDYSQLPDSLVLGQFNLTRSASDVRETESNTLTQRRNSVLTPLHFSRSMNNPESTINESHLTSENGSQFRKTSNRAQSKKGKNLHILERSKSAMSASAGHDHSASGKHRCTTSLHIKPEETTNDRDTTMIAMVSEHLTSSEVKKSKIVNAKHLFVKNISNPNTLNSKGDDKKGDGKIKRCKRHTLLRSQSLENGLSRSKVSNPSDIQVQGTLKVTPPFILHANNNGNTDTIVLGRKCHSSKSTNNQDSKINGTSHAPNDLNKRPTSAMSTPYYGLPVKEVTEQNTLEAIPSIKAFSNETVYSGDIMSKRNAFKSTVKSLHYSRSMKESQSNISKHGFVQGNTHDRPKSAMSLPLNKLKTLDFDWLAESIPTLSTSPTHGLLREAPNVISDSRRRNLLPIAACETATSTQDTLNVRPSMKSKPSDNISSGTLLLKRNTVLSNLHYSESMKVSKSKKQATRKSLREGLYKGYLYDKQHSVLNTNMSDLSKSKVLTSPNMNRQDTLKGTSLKPADLSRGQVLSPSSITVQAALNTTPIETFNLSGNRVSSFPNTIKVIPNDNADPYGSTMSLPSSLTKRDTVNATTVDNAGMPNSNVPSEPDLTVHDTLSLTSSMALLSTHDTRAPGRFLLRKNPIITPLKYSRSMKDYGSKSTESRKSSRGRHGRSRTPGPLFSRNEVRNLE